jgi:hypothetical protein
MNTIMEPMKRLQTLIEEAGRPRPTRGRKVREAAIHFEEKFRDRAFSAQEFIEWMRTEPTLEHFYDNPSLARKRLDTAGHRDDMPMPFQIVRKAKRTWAVQPVEKAILSSQIPAAFHKYFKKQETKLYHSLQACNWAEQDRTHQHTAWMIVLQYRNLQSMAFVALSGMQEIVSALDNGDLFRVEANGEVQTSAQLPPPTTANEA